MRDELRFNRRRALQCMGAAGIPPLSSLAGEVPDQPRQPGPTHADTGSLFSAIAQMAAGRDYTHSFLGSRFSSLEDYRAEGTAAVFDALGPRPAPVDASPQIVYRREMEWGTLEKVIFSTRREFRVPAYVLLPKGRQGRAPAIVDLHSHGGMFLFGKEKVLDLGANHPAMVEYHKTNYAGRPTATELVRRGYVVITIDAFPFGERRLVMDEDLDAGWDRAKYSIEDVRRLNRKCRAKESALVKSLTYAGTTWPGVTLWDDVRTLDYLCTRPEVDASRIGCVGVSFGGWRSLFLAGLDERIAAGCVVGFMSTVRPMIRAHMETHSFVHFVPSLHQRLDLPDVLALRAPKPLLVLQCKRDGLFPLDGMEESVRKLAAIYQKAGAAERFTGRFYDVPHRFDMAMQDDAFRWFDAQLKG